jgi:hypothetical protein
MTTNVCPACGYPTLGPALCAFCCPGEVLAGDQVFGPMSFAASPRRELTWPSAWDSNSAARVGVWPDPVAS